jgi:hypothetical protein
MENQEITVTVVLCNSNERSLYAAEINAIVLIFYVPEDISAPCIVPMDRTVIQKIVCGDDGSN